MKRLLLISLIVLAAVGGWFVGRKQPRTPLSDGGRKIAFYQSPMHPWIKSDKPGNCTICGMKLTPIYEGEKGFEAAPNMVTLNSNAINVINVQTETVEKRALQRNLEVAGRVEADPTRNRVISAYVDGRVEKLFVNYNGAEVKTGEPLAVIYSPALLTAEQEYLAALSQTNLRSTAKLAEQHDRLIESARQRLKRLGLTDAQVEQTRQTGSTTNFTTQIVAPASGTVMKRDIFEGQYVKEGDRLFELIDLSQVWFVFDVYEQDLPLVQLGQKVQVVSPSLPGKIFTGPVAFIEPTLNEATRSARVRVELQNPHVDDKRALYNGLYANGSIQFQSEPVLTVSRAAVLEPGDAARVYIDHGNGAYEQRTVTLGRRGTDFIEILSGLEIGENVVSGGTLLLDSQAQINQAVSGTTPHQHEDATETPAPQHTEHPTPASSNIQELTPFFDVMHSMGQALASDDLKAYNKHAAELPIPATPQLATLSKTVKASPAKALDAARVEFLPLSIAAAEAARAFKTNQINPGVKVFKCPMFPRPGKNALWVQKDGPLRNPFYGSEMLDCGTEVE
jgi:membrane fusion protein, copper/silver efflux system